jgi:glutamyl-tRNA synthetase
VGGARTALFNWFFARKHGGTFILRIEDTDYARSSEEMVTGILEGMTWLGITWDEGPYYQSQRLSLYREYAEQLRARGAAYDCFCSTESLQQRRQAAEKEGRAWKHDHDCYALSTEQVAEKRAHGIPAALRFKVPDGSTTFTDLVHGAIEVDHQYLEDFVLLRSDGIPTYHLCVVVDDIEMSISHVIRGADHISNTPKQLLIYQALRQPAPVFAHLPLILGPDKQRLSKRHGATSVMAYRDMGYVPEALVNFLALLGWSPGDDRELLTAQEITERFALENVNRTNAVFDLKKLEWMNGQYLMTLPEERLAELVKEELSRKNLWRPEFATTRKDWFIKTLNLLRTRTKRLVDFSDWARPFFTEDFEYEADAATKHLNDPILLDIMPELRKRFAELPVFDLASTEAALRKLAEDFGVKAGLIIGALRVALTGKSASPGIFDVVVTLGRESTLARLDRLIAYLQTTLVGSR